MTKTLSITLSVCISSLTASAIIGGYFLGRDAHTLLRNWAEFPTKTEEAIAGPRGTLHEVNKAVVKIGDSIVTTQLAERKVTPATVETIAKLGAAADKLGNAADALKETANAGTESAQALSLALQTTNEAIKGTQPLIGHLDASVQHFDALIQSPDLSAAITNVQFTTQNVAGVTLDMRKVADKMTADYLKPVKWYMQPVKRMGQIWDVGAAVSRHMP